MQILFLTNLLPYPLDSGGKIKTYSTLKALKRNHYVDLLCFRENQDDMMNKEQEMVSVCNSYYEVYQRITTVGNEKYMAIMAIRSLLSTLPLSSLKYKSEEMKGLIEERRNINYDLIYYDHLPMFVYYPLCKRLWPTARHILDEHNCEALLMRRNAKTISNPLKKAFMIFESKKIMRFEKASLLLSDDNVVLSKEDYIALKEIVGGDFNCKIVPISIIDKGPKKNKNHGDVLNILFVGTLTWAPNNQGLLWFLNNVIPIIESDKIEYHLYIVGKSPSREVIEKSKGNANITFTGYVDSVDVYYDLCDCSVIPLFIGSGQRVKLIEAFSKGMPAIATSIGAEGLKYENGRSIIIADSKEEFAKAIKLLTKKETRLEIGKNARQIFDEYYSTSVVEKRIIDIVEN